MKLWNLSAKNKGYGNDYYWNGTHFMTSAPMYIYLKMFGIRFLIHVRQGVMFERGYGVGTMKNVIYFPRIWRRITRGLY